MKTAAGRAWLCENVLASYYAYNTALYVTIPTVVCYILYFS